MKSVKGQSMVVMVLLAVAVTVLLLVVVISLLGGLKEPGAGTEVSIIERITEIFA